jgi:hypothetical protein
MFNVNEIDTTGADTIRSVGVCIAMQLNDNKQFDEMFTNAKDADKLCVLDIYRDGVKIDVLTVSLVDFAKTFTKFGSSDAKAYKWLKKRVQKRKAVAH